MKKKISILIFLFVFGIFSTLANAEDSVIDFMNNTPEIFVQNIKLDKTEYKAGDTIVGSVELFNNRDFFTSNINLKISLVGNYDNNLYYKDYYNEKISSFSVGGGESSMVNFSFKLPISSEAYSDKGQIGIKIKAFTDSEAPLGWDDTPIKVIGNTLSSILSTNPYIKVDGVNFLTQTGATVYKDKKVSLNVSLTSEEDITLYPNIVVYSKQTSQEPISILDGAPITLKGGEKKEISIDLPTFSYEKPGVYYGDIILKDNDGISRSSTFDFRYIIDGYLVNIVSVISDKTNFTKDENITLKISYTGPVPDDRKLMQEVATTTNSIKDVAETVELSVKVFNEKDVLVAEYDDKAEYSPVVSRELTLKSLGDAQTIYTKVVFSKDGKIIGSYESKLDKDFDVIKEEINKKNILYSIIILVVMIALILLIVIFLRFKNKKGVLLSLLIILGFCFSFNKTFALTTNFIGQSYDLNPSYVPTISSAGITSTVYGDIVSFSLKLNYYFSVCSCKLSSSEEYMLFTKWTDDKTNFNNLSCTDRDISHSNECFALTNVIHPFINVASKNTYSNTYESKIGSYLKDKLESDRLGRYNLQFTGYASKDEPGSFRRRSVSIADTESDQLVDTGEHIFSKYFSFTTQAGVHRFYIIAQGKDKNLSSIVSPYSRIVAYEDITVPGCGLANGTSVLSAPTNPNLCSFGTASSVSGSGPWSWTCTGTAGASIGCSATKPSPAPVEIIFSSFAPVVNGLYTISSGSSAILSWTTNADNCNLSLEGSGWDPVTINPTFGTTNTGVLTANINDYKEYIYTLSCQRGTSTSSKNVSIRVNGLSTPAPTVDLYRTDGKTDVYAGDLISLGWNSTTTTSCSASVDWSGEKDTNGDQGGLQVLKDNRYVLTCSGGGGEVTDSVDVVLSECPTYTSTSSECNTDTDTFHEVVSTYCINNGEVIFKTDIDTEESCSLPTTMLIECSPSENFIKDVQSDWLIELLGTDFTNIDITEINITHGQETVSGNIITIPKIYTSTGEKTFQATTTAVKGGLTYTGTCTATTTVSGGGGATGQ
ncbi:MAG: hypothetical protein PHN69_01255 [Candidatus Pacebacteria bacterium]|nr:hypothetical protein [Candidatus Paceibacterota bacterium]